METIIPVFRKAVPSLLIFLFPALLGAQVLVTPINGPADAQGKRGAVYVLPRTVLKVDVQVKAVYKYRGPYADQAESMLGVTEYIKETGEQYEITGATIRSFTEPDPEQYYFVQLEEKSDRSFDLQLGPEGVITSAGSIPGDAPRERKQQELLEVFPYFKPAALKEEVDTIHRIISVDTVTIQKYLLRNTLVRQTNAEKAREAADMINVLKQDKYNILIGYQETAYEKEAMKYMVDRLEKMEMEYLKLFTGSTSTETLNYSFFFIPGSDDDNTLFYFSEDKGVDERSGEAVRLLIEDAGLVESLPDQSAATGRTGIFYRIPGRADITLEYDGNSLEQQRMVVNQLGKILYLPPTATHVTLDPLTGNLRQVTLQP